MFASASVIYFKRLACEEELTFLEAAAALSIWTRQSTITCVIQTQIIVTGKLCSQQISLYRSFSLLFGM
jgi:hypothetical protein